MKTFECNLNGQIAVELDDMLRIKVSRWDNGVWVDSIVMEPGEAENLAHHVFDLIDIQAAEKAKDEPSVSWKDLKKELGL